MGATSPSIPFAPAPPPPHSLRTSPLSPRSRRRQDRTRVCLIDPLSSPPPPLPQRIHFLKEDERLLRKLLSKIKAQADTVRKRAIVKGGGLCFV